MSVRSENPPGNRSVGDPFNRAFPIGIGARFTDDVALDLETVAGDPTGPRSATGVTIDSGSSTAPRRSCSAADRLGHRWADPLPADPSRPRSR